MSVFLSQRFTLPVQHTLTVDRHSPVRHGHDLKVIIKVPVVQSFTESRLKVDSAFDSIKKFFSDTDLGESGEHATTEGVLLKMVPMLKERLGVKGIIEITIEETSKNTFKWKNDLLDS